jgi:hypothetical protein
VFCSDVIINVVCGVAACLLQEHAQQQQADAPEESFEDEWAALPPEVLAMVAELQSRG